MPTLARLAISGVRNISPETSLEPGPGFNLIFGSNGSGKTSVLEALYLLGMGRSFRSHLQKPLITHDQPLATVFGQTTDGLTIGIQRPQRGQQTIKIAGRPAEGLAQLSRTLPLQLINSDTFQLLEGSPQERRQFLDWGVFHVEHQFLDYWRRARQALDQRNMLLRNEASASEIEPWSYELAHNAGFINNYRRAYLQQLSALLETTLTDVGPPGNHVINIEYLPGWDPEADLFDQLQDGLARDRKYGFTTLGPHKADLRFLLKGLSAAEVLSRGQLKLLICALKVVQSQLLVQANGTQSLFLLDDLPAELDAENRIKVCHLLGGLKAQVFVTSIEQSALAAIAREQADIHSIGFTQFHVKHGKIDPV
ncbi:MAG: DNA replication/repair protein RecF [Pseudomonadota bacterium]